MCGPKEPLNKTHHTTMPPLFASIFSPQILLSLLSSLSNHQVLSILFKSTLKTRYKERRRVINIYISRNNNLHHNKQQSNTNIIFFFHFICVFIINMAVEAHHLNLLSPQLININREMMNPIDTNINLYNTTQINYPSVLPLSGTTTTTENVFRPPYNTLKSDSSLTYNVPLSRKRSRENSNIINYPYSSYTTTTQNHKKSNCSSFSFLGEDLSLHFQQQQLDINNIIAERLEKVRIEIEEKRKGQLRKFMEAIEVGVMKRLKTKEDEIEKIGKLNWALEEKIKSLCIENQIWRNLAQTNEATANALRNELEQVLIHRAGGDENETTVCPGGAAAALMDDASSCCGSTDGDNKKKDSEGVWRTIMGCAGMKDKEGSGKGIIGKNDDNMRLCKNCGKEESCVLILPCRHLCLCNICGSSLHNCPICKSFKNASVHINMS
ncbi:PREDICTED: probable BOI-related E3 ubiquitin-protein ligase 3 isoform X2 [Lupinus angustifolius]|uniref:probable BOI-related E3 ubiquitin-protein ligase 3 isoform X2 n=1 Tax=Lupinus angustifolius TaxID=3871 RepID=UPI00092EBD6E|nr:PREDICTED: probable BOI-related E3 ubiquitin-protein ligase 3 isoform X2 [Lupinus angustifolius]